jgi:hypothetical protein
MITSESIDLSKEPFKVKRRLTKDLEADFNKFVKYYLIKSSLTPKTQQTFNDLIDEL